jgi:hypothetical protein
MTFLKVIRRSIVLMLVFSVFATSTAFAGRVDVEAAFPEDAEQDTQQLPVTIDGEGFDEGTVAVFLVEGSKDNKGGVTVTRTQYINPNRLIATIDVDEEATVGKFDIAVTTSRGRRGKGNTLFSVKEKSGGNSNPYDGEDIPLNCEIMNESMDEFGNPIANTVLNDGAGSYRNGEQKVECSLGGTVQPNLSGIVVNTVNSGPVKKAIRKIDINFGPCVGPACEYVPSELHDRAASAEDMEDIALSIRPYAEMDHIQLMSSGVVRSMAARIGTKAFADRFGIQLMQREIPEDFHQGVWCDLSYHPTLDPIDAISEDVSVYNWPDHNGDGIPDGYTVTTGIIDDTFNTSPPDVIAGTRIGAICSNVQGPGLETCGGPSRSDMCNLLGFVEVGFTIHARNQ